MAWTMWKSDFDNVCSIHAPLKSIRVRNRNNPWMTADILTMMYERDYLHKKATRYKDDETWDQYRQKRNSVVHAINKVQRLFYQNEVRV